DHHRGARSPWPDRRVLLGDGGAGVQRGGQAESSTPAQSLVTSWFGPVRLPGHFEFGGQTGDSENPSAWGLCRRAQAASLHPHHPRSPGSSSSEPPSRRSILPTRRPSPMLQLSSPLSFPIGPWGSLVRALFGDRAGLMRAAFGWARRL